MSELDQELLDATVRDTEAVLVGALRRGRAHLLDPNPGTARAVVRGPPLREAHPSVEGATRCVIASPDFTAGQSVRSILRRSLGPWTSPELPHGHDWSESEATIVTTHAEDVPELQARYRQLAVDWSEARDDPDEANRILREHHALYKQLRESAEGREAIAGLLGDDQTAVRLVSATHTLAFQPEAAERTLEDIENSTGPYAMDARWTLRSFRTGRLNLDW